jgi:hypothetical protein
MVVLATLIMVHTAAASAVIGQEWSGRLQELQTTPVAAIAPAAPTSAATAPRYQHSSITQYHHHQ